MARLSPGTASLNLLDSHREGSPGLKARSVLVLRAAGAEAFTAENWPSGRGLERHGVGLAALIAGNLKSLAFTAAATTTAPRSAKILTPRVATGFAAFRLAQVALLVIFLFALCKRKSLAAFGTSDVHVWHDWFLPSKQSASLSLDLCDR